MKTINNQWIFIDESGKPEVYSSRRVNLVENQTASKFLVLAAIRSKDQLRIQQQVTEFRLSLLKDTHLSNLFSPAYTLDTFHAQTDYFEVKQKFYQYITTLSIKIDVIVVEKLLCYDMLKQNPGRLYGVMAGQLLKNLCHQSVNTEIIFSRKDSKLKLRQELVAEVEKVRVNYLEKHPFLKPNLNLQYFHNPHYSHGGLQIADYIAYAVFQVFERNNFQWYDVVKKKIGKIQDICNKKYFTQSNPLELST